MEGSLRVIAACVMASVCLSVVAAEKPTAKAKAQAIDYSKAITIPITDKLKEDLRRFIRLRSTLLVKLTDEECKLQSGGVCPIMIPILLVEDPEDPAKEYCVAVFPEVVKLPGAGSSSTEKTVVWSLVMPGSATKPPGATFTFYSEKDHGGQKDMGILLLKNGSNQMHSGTRGDGTSAQPDKTKYLFKNKHKIPNAKGVYLPIVVRTDNAGTSSEKVSVCGTPDPLIETTP